MPKRATIVLCTGDGDIVGELDPVEVDAPWWQRLIFAPFGVNYHMEHHFMASVPCYRLRALREHLRRQSALADVPVFRGYGAVLRHAVAA